MSNDPTKLTDEVAAVLSTDPAIWAGAEADYDHWRQTGPVELPALAEADPYIRKVFLDRAARILHAAKQV